MLPFINIAGLIYVFTHVTGAEKIVGWGLSSYLMLNAEADPKDAKLVLSSGR